MENEKAIRVPITRCPKCGELHDGCRAVAKPGDNGATHEAECPKTGERFPVWHSTNVNEEEN